MKKLLMIAALLALVGCGSDSPDYPPPESRDLVLTEVDGVSVGRSDSDEIFIEVYPSEELLTQAEARQWCADIGWRLPTIDELVRGVAYRFRPEGPQFREPLEGPEGYYWSIDINHNGDPLFVRTGWSETVDIDYVPDFGYARCVRSTW